MSGPLTGIRVVELAAIGPAPHAAMVLADLGAEVVCVERPSGSASLPFEADLTMRGRQVIRLDLKSDVGREEVMRLVEGADVLVEGMRPGVTERLGIGPDACLARNPGLIYARMTGWGQTGPRAEEVGHDINYVALTGALHAMGTADSPPPVPLNVVADMGGGSMLLLVGILAALVERQKSGRGQVVDAAMVDGVVLLSQLVLSLKSLGVWTSVRHDNLLDGGAPFYSTYACADGGFVAVGALEPRFYAALLTGLGLDSSDAPDRDDKANWPALREVLATRFASRTRDEWAAHFAGTEACVTPVLSFEEAADDPHLAARGTYQRVAGHLSAAPAPRFSRTPATGMSS